MHWTEQHIRRALDGTFTHFAHGGSRGTRTVTEDVPLDFVPDYNPPPEPPLAPSTKGILRKPWAPSEDELLLALRKDGVTLNACTEILRRGIKQIRARLLVLKAMEAAQ